MNWTQWAWIGGAFYGMTGVILGAFGAHALRGKLAERSMDAFVTATRYQLTHAVVLLVIALLLTRLPSTWLKASAGLLLGGVLLFSGSIYLLTLVKLRVGVITPIGGLLLICGWLCLLVAGFSSKLN
ncbi:MAG: DUF423 domain-containing protein [Myxococcales bacterium]|nr:DUF423 domain-containing protein [Myxococcales bacterium]MCB9643699.1 DUF423 domain-containing protein [Myxococcales bacterium]